MEIDVAQISEMKDACQLCVSNGMPGIVVHPSLSSNAITERGLIGGMFGIASPIDAPLGHLEGVAKFRHLTTETLEADGFEIYVNMAGKKSIQLIRYFTGLHDFVRNRISQVAEIRYALVDLNSENIKEFITALANSPTPKCIRNDAPAKTQVKNANIDSHRTYIKMIREHTNIPIKVSGNISYQTGLAILNEPNTKIAVNLSQAQSIVKEFHGHNQSH